MLKMCTKPEDVEEQTELRVLIGLCILLLSLLLRPVVNE